MVNPSRRLGEFLVERKVLSRDVLEECLQREESGGPPRFGHLEGIRVRKRPRGVEVMPYLLTRASYVAPTQPGSPFQARGRYDAPSRTYTLGLEQAPTSAPTP